MTRKSLIIPALTVLAAAFAAPAFAQEAKPADAAQPAPAPASTPAPVEDAAMKPVEATATSAPGDAEPADPDNMANYLNSQQQIKQGVTFTRTIDGKVVETKQETITYSKDDPVNSTEAGMSPLEKLKAAFDSETLTRKEAVDEAKLDFVVADKDRDGVMTADEFVYLVDGWQNNEVEGGGSNRFVDPVSHANPQEAAAEHEKQARAKFAFMAGEAGTLKQKQYLKSAMFDFDTFDANHDGVLEGQELLNYREANRGEPAGANAPAANAATSADEPQE